MSDRWRVAAHSLTRVRVAPLLRVRSILVVAVVGLEHSSLAFGPVPLLDERDASLCALLVFCPVCSRVSAFRGESAYRYRYLIARAPPRSLPIRSLQQPAPVPALAKDLFQLVVDYRSRQADKPRPPMH